MDISEKSINTIRCLSIDAVEKANSGHPGAPMALAPAAYALFKKIMKFNPKNPDWFNRDRFILSNGHASILQYAILHLLGYEISLDDLKDFRQLDSITPGHPEHGITPGIETTTGPLGQGFMTAVGMAVAEAHLSAIFNTKDCKLVDHYTFVFCSDGDLMEGASHETASFAGNLGLEKLIYLYDDNHITIEGDTALAYSDDVSKRFEAYNFHVQKLENCANDVDAISRAFENAKHETEKPSIIILRTNIGYGSPNKHDTSEVHGSPLGKEEIKLTKEFLAWPQEPFYEPSDVLEHMGESVDAGKKWEAEWDEKLKNYKEKHPELGKQFDSYLTQEIPHDWEELFPTYEPKDGDMATRSVTKDVLKIVNTKMPWLMGGSADLGESTATFLKESGYVSKAHYENSYIDWGIREHLMCAANTGLTVHGGVRTFCSTYFCFTDYAKPAIRMAAIMEQPVIFVMTHDSIGLGEDGKTHQPVEQLITFRAMPNIVIIRPADANEASQAWKIALERKNMPTMLVMSRQKLPIFDRAKLAPADGLRNGAYILTKEEGDQLDAIIIGTGSEVQYAVEAQKSLRKSGVHTRVVSMPSWELFLEQSEAYRNEVLPPNIKNRVAIEAGSTSGWHEWVGLTGKVIGMTGFGASAPAKDLFKHFGFTVDHVVETVRQMVESD